MPSLFGISNSTDFGEAFRCMHVVNACIYSVAQNYTINFVVCNIHTTQKTKNYVNRSNQNDVCVSVCLSAAACLHYCTNPDVTWWSGRGCPLVVHNCADLQSVYGLRCYGNITRTRNVSEYMLVLALCLVYLVFLTPHILGRRFAVCMRITPAYTG